MPLPPALCPDCREPTAVPLGDGFACHCCNRAFAAGLVRVPRAWGRGGEAMAAAAHLPLPYPDVAVIEEERLEDQTATLAAALPARPIVLGGCCCAHIGAITGLAARLGRIGLVWFDSHGDLNTPTSSPSGNLWGMPLRMLLDGGVVDVRDVVLIGARDLDPPERDFIVASGLRIGAEGLEAALARVEAAYVALDCDSIDPDEGVVPFMPQPGGLALAEVEGLLQRITRFRKVVGAGFTGLTADERNVAPLWRLCRALGF